MTRKQKAKQQRQQRRAGEVRRVEFVLHSDQRRDLEIDDYLSSLAPGQRGEFIRRAIYAAVTGQQNAPEPETVEQLELPEPARPEGQDTSASAAFEAILRELADLRSAMQHSKPGQKRAPSEAGSGPETQRPNAGGSPPIPAGDKVVVSSGLDLSGPRRRTPRAASAPPPLIIEPAFSPEDSARMLINSIRGYSGQHVRGPGK